MIKINVMIEIGKGYSISKNSSMKRKNDCAEMSFGNRIKLTPIGQDIIQSVEWDASSSYPSRKGLTSECHLTSKHILPHVSKYSK
jgi:hypothetical protein